MTEHSRVNILRALLAKHEDDGLEEKRKHTYRWDQSDGREKQANTVLVRPDHRSEA